MHEGNILGLVETLAAQVVGADAGDESSLIKLMSLLQNLKAQLEDAEPAVLQCLDECYTHLNNLLGGQCADPDAELDATSAAVCTLQELLSAAPVAEQALVESVGVESAGEGQLVLPEWADEAVFREFLEQQGSVLEEIESDILEMEKMEEEAESRLRRRIHTMKGEAGVLGLEAIEQACHGIEDFLDLSLLQDQRVEALFAYKDWLGRAQEAYTDFRTPAETASALLERLDRQWGPASTTNSTASAASSGQLEDSPEADQETAETAVGPAQDDAVATPEPVAPPATASVPVSVVTEPEPGDVEAVADSTLPVAESACAEDDEDQLRDHLARDEETLELVTDFLQESGESIGVADGILLNAEDQGVDKEPLDALFRVFHTLKGVAGFLEFKAVAALAHTTETLLNQAREGKVTLQGPMLDLIFDSTQQMRALLDGIRTAVESGAEVAVNEDLPTLLDRLQQAIAGDLQDEEQVIEVGSNMKLGEVLSQVTGVSEQAVAAALEHQKETGAPIGKQLLDDGAAQPKQISQALRAQAKSRVRIRETVKVDLDRVDNLVALIGELVIVESMVVNDPEVAGITNHRVRKHIAQLGTIARDLQDVGMRMRMVPVRNVFQKMARMVRDLSRSGGKQIQLKLDGEGVEMDRSMVEQIGDPLVHMIRNAVDHAIEPADERKAAGKPAAGNVSLSAYHEGGAIVIELSDDGRGLNREVILAKAIKRGLIKESDKLSDQEVYSLIFSAGLSTAEKVTEISGRGVGMDVVKRNIEAMRGRVLITSGKGRGTTFKILLPLTLAIIDGMVVECGAERYIIPTLSIVESVQPTANMLYAVAGREELFSLRGKTLPLLRLDRLLGIPGAKSNALEALVVIVESGGQRVGLLVDDVVTRQQVVIKTLSGGLADVPSVAGAAILADGNVGLILNIDEVSKLSPSATPPGGYLTQSSVEPGNPSVLQAAVA